MTRTIMAFTVLLLASGAGAGAGASEPVNRSTIAFALAEKDLLPENVAYDPKSRSFFVGSTRKGKILRVDAEGGVTEFAGPRAHGLWMVIGMKVDAARRRLWVASSAGSNLVDYRKESDRGAGLFAFDLDSGALLARHLLADDGATHFLNDLALAPDGDVYVTHMFDAAQVWRLDAKTGTFAAFYRGDSEFRDPNGIAMTPDGRALYVAHDGGVSRINLDDRERCLLEAPSGLKVGGADGLYLHGRSLVAVQPGAKQVVRWTLDRSGKKVLAEEVLESGHPLFDEPTTGVLVGDWLYYIANAQFGRFDAENRLLPLERLYQPVVLKLPLAQERR